MREKKIVLFDDNLFFCETILTVLQVKNVSVVMFYDFGHVMKFLSETDPFIVITTDCATIGVTQTQIHQLKRYHPNIHVVLFVYQLLAEKEARELRRIPGISIVSMKNSLNTLDIILDVLFAGYHIYDSNTVANNDISMVIKDSVLSPMENKVLAMMTHGISVKDMSKTLNIAEKTVMTYKRRFLCKLGAHSLRDCLIP